MRIGSELMRRTVKKEGRFVAQRTIGSVSPNFFAVAMASS